MNMNMNMNTCIITRPIPIGSSGCIGVRQPRRRLRHVRGHTNGHTNTHAGPRLVAGAVPEGPAAGWFDLANFVATSSSNKTPFDDLASSIGKDVYIDVMGWHLFLRDVKISGGDQSLAQALATKIGSDLMSTGRFDEQAVEEVLQRTPVVLGRGKVTLSLMDVVPSVVLDDLKRLCEEFCRRNV